MFTAAGSTTDSKFIFWFFCSILREDTLRFNMLSVLLFLFAQLSKFNTILLQYSNYTFNTCFERSIYFVCLFLLNNDNWNSNGFFFKQMTHFQYWTFLLLVPSYLVALIKACLPKFYFCSFLNLKSGFFDGHNPTIALLWGYDGWSHVKVHIHVQRITYSTIIWI